MSTTTRPTPTLADYAAILLSGLTSPFVTICACALWVIGAVSPSVAGFARLSLPFVVLVVLPPLVYILAGMQTGKVTDLHVRLREQRGAPFAVATVGSAALTAAWVLMRAPHALTALAVNLVVNGLLFAVLTSRWKVSIHTGAFAAAVVICAMLVDGRLLLLYIGLPLVVWGRVRRGRHSVVQCVAAAGLAAATSLVALVVTGSV